jgi:hypothetical protein
MPKLGREALQLAKTALADGTMSGQPDFSRTKDVHQIQFLQLPEVLRRRAKSRSAHYADISRGLCTRPVKIGKQPISDKFGSGCVPRSLVLLPGLPETDSPLSTWRPSMHLASEWVDRIFEKLTLVYGRDFLGRWDGLDIRAVKADWAHELGRFANAPDSIRFALDSLPPSKPPTALEFKQLCNRAPEYLPVLLRPPQPSVEQKQRVRALLQDVHKRLTGREAKTSTHT